MLMLGRKGSLFVNIFFIYNFKHGPNLQSIISMAKVIGILAMEAHNKGGFSRISEEQTVP